VQLAVGQAVEPLKAVGELRRYVGDGDTLNTVVAQCVQHVEDAVKAALDNSAAKFKEELGISS